MIQIQIDQFAPVQLRFGDAKIRRKDYFLKTGSLVIRLSCV